MVQGENDKISYGVKIRIMTLPDSVAISSIWIYRVVLSTNYGNGNLKRIIFCTVNVLKPVYTWIFGF